ncbi:MAG: hypothetical protein ABIP89_01120 [Polyangiaceae bacterium]
MADLTKTRALATKTKARAEALVEHVVEKKQEMAILFYEIGDALHTLLEDKLYASLGYDSFDALVEDRALMSLTQAKKLIEVRRTFGRAQALTLGPEKAYALARYAARTKKADEAAELVERGFPIGGKRRPVEDVSIREIQMATRVAVSRQSGEHGANERARHDAEGELRAVKAGLKDRGIEGATAGLVFRHGSWSVTLVVPAHKARSALKLAH